MDHGRFGMLARSSPQPVSLSGGIVPAAGAESLPARLRDDGAWVLGPPLGVTDDTACRDSVQRTRAGRLDVLVNNAVILLGPIIDADTDDWRRMMTTNVLGLM